VTWSDPYSSRVGGEARTVPRKDPVIHDAETASRGPLDAEQLERFDREGLLELQRFFDVREMEPLRDEAERLKTATAEANAEAIVHEPESGEVRSVFAIHESSPVFARLIRQPRLLDIATQILGSDVCIHQSRINYKPAFRGREFDWHSDFETWHVEDGMPRMRALSLSICLFENNPYNGALMLVPESHRVFVSCRGRTPERHYERSLQRQEFGVPEREIVSHLVRRSGITAPTGPPGSILLFDCNTLHGSNGNITPWPRTNLFYVFNSTLNRLEAPFSGQPPRPEHIASRRFEPLAHAG